MLKANRREFLQLAAGGTTVLSLSGGLPGLWLRAAWAETSPDPGQRVLVVIQLSGGNDGLNTIVPSGDETYYARRPTLGIPRPQVLAIDDFCGWHPRMRGFADLLEEESAAVVQAVGYPDPNRSHFESMDIWHTCQRKDGPRRSGWLGRGLDATVGETGADVPALHLGGGKQPLALAAERVRVPSVQSLDRFRLKLAGWESLQSTVQDAASADRPDAGELLDFVQSSTTSALRASRRVEAAQRSYEPAVSYPASGLAEKLKTVAQLLDAQLATRVYYLELDGFDTHAQQPDAHAALLGQLSDAVRAFLQDVAAHGHGERVLVSCFSEFGRRVEENASEGTDHGAAGPMLLAGQTVRAGLIGEHPSLTDLDQGDLKFAVDFRRVYAGLLRHWLGWDSEAILGGDFEPLELLA